MPDVWWGDEISAVAGAFIVALVLYVFVVLAFRAGKRRTVAELAPFDLAAVIAVGAITGRTATGGNSVVVGVVAVLGLFLGHVLVSWGRRFRPVRSLVDHPTSVLVIRGAVQKEELRRSGLTRADLDATLRNHGIRNLDEVVLAVFETRNGVSVLRTEESSSLWDELGGAGSS